MIHLSEKVFDKLPACRRFSGKAFIQLPRLRQAGSLSDFKVQLPNSVPCAEVPVNSTVNEVG
jgi:hypothetical protein